MMHLLSAGQLSHDEAVELLDLAEEMVLVNERDIKKLPSLRGKTVCNLFFEDSTRTRISFELAAKRLSADVVNFAAKGSSISKGESLKDTVQTLEAMGANAIVIRHPASGAAQTLAHSGWISSNVINAGDGKHEHPTQALLDAFTIRKRIHGDQSRAKSLGGIKVLIVGDILHSRVARSNALLLQTLGADVHFVAPPTLMPIQLLSDSARQWYNFDQALASVQPDAVMMLRVQQERMQASYFPSTHEYSALWGMNSDRFSKLKSAAIVMHPGPMNRGLEIDSLTADSRQSTVLEQVANGVAVRMAVLYKLIASGKEPQID